jgi:hypothetical protein
MVTTHNPPGEAEKINDGYREQLKRKRNCSDEKARIISKTCTTSITTVASRQDGRAAPVANHLCFTTNGENARRNEQGCRVGSRGTTASAANW